jgi:signal transduction histidine kinase
MPISLKKNILPYIRKIGIKEDDSEETRLRKSILVNTSIVITIAAIVWGFIYILFNEPIAGSLPLIYSIISTFSFIILIRTLNFKLFRITQLAIVLIIPFLLMIALGGFIKGSAVIIWGLLAPIGALLCNTSQSAKRWFLTYVILIIISGILQPFLEIRNNLPNIISNIFFVINIGVVSAIVIVTLNYFVKKKELVIKLIKKNRELELAYLQQEITLRQSEKLATLGKLSAGMAHEINNPASAAQRGAVQLGEHILTFKDVQYKLGEMKLTESQLNSMDLLNKQIREKAKLPNNLKPLEQDKLENEMELWLEGKGISNPWKYSSTLVNIGLTKEELTELSKNFDGDQFPFVIESMSSIYVIHSLIEEIGQGAGRITEIVKALKSYSYMDRAPIQSIDVHEGLNNTLVMFGSQLKKGIAVERRYSKDLPQIQAYGSELNQVWTNIIDNSIKAMNGSGKIIITTYKQNDSIVIEIKDTGPGIPEEIQEKVFDPFFTTKSPGEGTGLGLSISHNIITQRHRGEISVKSRPGETLFRVKLPINNSINKN